MKTLTEKQREYNSLSNEIRELKDEFKNALLTQDELFRKHFYEKEELIKHIKVMENENHDLIE